ncbi:MAG: thioredoxin-disulfide reductase [Pseudomonadota bacterium]|jgi:thioredoxin reductase (NADPH)|nr:thioredoxin-disulfide reductase [Alphaproteobacteria bacterium]
MTNHTKVLIIGAGPAGYTAAIYAARANLHPIQLLGPQPGGQLTITTDVENYPGFKDVIQGPWLMDQMNAQAAHVGTDMRFESVETVDFSKRPFVVTTDTPTTYTADTVIIATGAQAKWLGLDSELHFRGYGVSGCATCDGFFFKDKKVAVIGGGNSAVEEAIYLTNHCAHVTLIHRRDHLRAEKIAQDRLFKNPKISVLWDTVVEEFTGNDQPVRSLTGLKLKNLKTQEVINQPFDGAFVAIGHTPMSTPFKDQLKCDHEGYILTTPGSTATSIPGVFAAGDVQDKIFRQAVTAAGQGCMAALEAEKLLNH